MNKKTVVCMRVKTDARSGLGEASVDENRSNAAKNESRPSVFMRAMTCASLIALLAAGGFAGAGGGQSRVPAAPVASLTRFEADAAQEMTYEEILVRYQSDREREIALLDGVIENPLADAGTKRDALAQKTQIAARMEAEAQVRAALLLMGIQAAAISAGQQMTVIVGDEAMEVETQCVRIIDAACSVLGIPPSDVKIILAKK